MVPLFKDDAREEKAEDWPATFMGSFVTPQGSGICTATLVGSRTLITAAHCVAPDRKMTVRRGGDRWTATCSTHSTYSPTWDAGCSTAGNCPTSADYALCFIELGQGESAPNFPRHERLNTDPAALAVGGVLKLLGFGCTDTTQTGGSSLSKEILSSGWARVSQVPAPPQYNYVTANWDLQGAALPTFTTVTGGANICPGDSGGAIFLSAKSSPTIRSIVALASRVYTNGGNITGPSLLSATSTPAAINMLKAWSTKTDLCGVKSDHPACALQ